MVLDPESAALGALVMLTVLLLGGALFVGAFALWVRGLAARGVSAFTEVSAKRVAGKVQLFATVTEAVAELEPTPRALNGSLRLSESREAAS